MSPETFLMAVTTGMFTALAAAINRNAGEWLLKLFTSLLGWIILYAMLGLGSTG